MPYRGGEKPSQKIGPQARAGRERTDLDPRKKRRKDERHQVAVFTSAPHGANEGGNQIVLQPPHPPNRETDSETDYHHDN